MPPRRRGAIRENVDRRGRMSRCAYASLAPGGGAPSASTVSVVSLLAGRYAGRLAGRATHGRRVLLDTRARLGYGSRQPRAGDVRSGAESLVPAEMPAMQPQ